MDNKTTHNIADYYCPKSKLVVEIDGGQDGSTEGKKKDKERKRPTRLNEEPPENY